MNSSIPTVSIGMPLYNAEQYVEQAIESILAQTYADFELLISDNASTDKTGEICRGYAESDSRIRYVRNDTNLGAAQNFNNVFKLSRGKYFKWAAYDDLLASEFLCSCVEVLEANNQVVLCYSMAIQIDAQGKEIKQYRADLSNVSANEISVRFGDLIRDEYNCLPVFGLIRSETLKRTPLIGPYVGSDRVLLVELGLYGQFVELDRALFYHREHNERSTRSIPLRQRTGWFDPKRAKVIVFPYWRYLREYISSIRRSPISGRERRLCYIQLLKWIKWYREDLLSDLKMAFKQLVFRSSA